jgi:hypothetical protein
MGFLGNLGERIAVFPPPTRRGPQGLKSLDATMPAHPGSSGATAVGSARRAGFNPPSRGMHLPLFPPEKVVESAKTPPDLAGAVALMRNRARFATPFTAMTNDPRWCTFGHQSPEFPGSGLLREGFRGPRGPTVGAKPKPRPDGLGHRKTQQQWTEEWKSHISCTHFRPDPPD